MFGSNIILQSHDRVQQCGKVTFQEQESKRLDVFVRLWPWSGKDSRLHVETRQSRCKGVLCRGVQRKD